MPKVIAITQNRSGIVQSWKKVKEMVNPMERMMMTMTSLSRSEEVIRSDSRMVSAVEFNVAQYYSKKK